MTYVTKDDIFFYLSLLFIIFIAIGISVALLENRMDRLEKKMEERK